MKIQLVSLKMTLLAVAALFALACDLSAMAALPSPTTTAQAVNNSTPTTRTHDTCIVTAPALHLRTAPDAGAPVLTWLHAGNVLTLLNDPPAENWIRVKAGELSGWINSNYCEEIK